MINQVFVETPPPAAYFLVKSNSLQSSSINQRRISNDCAREISVLIAELTPAEEDPGAVKNSHVTGSLNGF